MMLEANLNVKRVAVLFEDMSLAINLFTGADYVTSSTTAPHYFKNHCMNLLNTEPHALIAYGVNSKNGNKCICI